MKTSVIVLVIACGVIAGAIVLINKQKSPPPPAPVAETSPTQPEPQPQEVVSAPKPQPAPAVAAPAAAPAVTAAPVSTNNTAATEETNSILKTVDALLAARGEKHAMFEQLRKDNKLDAVIAELQKRAAENPNDVAIPTTLGEALLNKVRAMRESGITDPTDLGIFALQADQQFNAALKIDPKNWEAQFVKASTMFYWPPDAARDADAAQRLASLIDQQDAMATQPDAFAMTYIALGKQYQKMGKMNEATATWALGAQKFPGNADLQKLKTGQ